MTIYDKNLKKNIPTKTFDALLGKKFRLHKGVVDIINQNAYLRYIFYPIYPNDKGEIVDIYLEIKFKNKDNNFYKMLTEFEKEDKKMLLKKFLVLINRLCIEENAEISYSRIDYIVYDINILTYSIKL